MIRDIIISYKINNLIYRRLDFFRADIEGNDLNKIKCDAIDRFFSEGEKEFPNSDQIMTIYQSLTPENADHYLPVMNYLGFYVDVHDRLDLVAIDPEAQRDSTIVYLRDPKAGSIAISTNEATSTPDCIVNMFTHKLTMDPTLAEIVNLNFDIDTYNSLAGIDAGSEFDATKLLNFITSNDRELKIYVE